jgi:ATP-binding cassette subfamily B multidrug efflux pump
VTTATPVKKRDDDEDDRRDEDDARRAFERGLLRRLLGFCVPHRRLLLVALVLFPLVAATQLAQPWVLKLAIDGPVLHGQAERLAPYALAYLGLAVLQAGLGVAQGLLMQLAGQRMMRDIRTRLFERVLSLSQSFFDRTPVGKVLTRLTGDVEALNELLTANLVLVLGDTVLLAGIVVTMLLLDWRLALWSFALVLPLVAFVAWLRGRLREIFRAIRNRTTRLNAFLAEAVAGVLVLQAFVREPRHRADHARLNERVHAEGQRSVTWSSVLSAVIQLAQTLTTALLLWAALGRDMAGEEAVSLGLVVAFVDYVERFYAPIDNLSARYTVLQTALAAAEKIFRLMDEPDVLPEPASPKPVPPLARGVTLDHVTFRYATGSDVLKDVTLEVPKGQTVALVGATGAGKTTVTRLLGRFHDPSEGAVRWDGVDLRELDSRALRGRIAYVPQETFLFSDTLERNVALDPAAVPAERARAAANALGADAVAADLPLGWQQPLGERGHDLSAGERQLVSFARALARDPDLLILDEATAQVDGETEARVQAALAKLLAGRTAVVIAHRLSTIRRADKIVVLHKGQVREQGTHEELIARKGLYFTLVELQAKES